MPTQVPCWEQELGLELSPWPPIGGKQSQGLGNSGHEPQPGLGKQQLCLEHCTWRFLSHPKDKQKGKLENGLSLMGNTPSCPSSLSHSRDGRHHNVRVTGTNQCE